MRYSTAIQNTVTRVRRGLSLGGVVLCATVQAQVGMTTLSVGDLPVTLVYPTGQAAQSTVIGPFELQVGRGTPRHHPARATLS